MGSLLDCASHHRCVMEHRGWAVTHLTASLSPRHGAMSDRLLAHCFYPKMAPVLILLRPSNEHILIVRVLGARDRHGCHFTPLLVP
jgi:hypothetical protein